MVAAGTKGASTGVRSGIPTRTVTVSASQGKAVPLVATGSKGASSLKAAGPAQVGKVPGAPATAVASKGTQVGSKSASGELRAVGPVNVGKSSSGTAKPTVGQRLKAVGANAAVMVLLGGPRILLRIVCRLLWTRRRNGTGAKQVCIRLLALQVIYWVAWRTLLLVLWRNT